MKPRAMLKKPVELRRGAVTQETGSWGYLLVDAPPDRVLDALLGSSVIGAARRDCLAEIRAGKVTRPVGPWGILVRLKGHRWTYVLGDGLRFEWPRQWAGQHGWRVAWFSLDGMINTKIARLYDGGRELFDFVCGLIKEPEPGFFFRENLNDESAMIRGEDGTVCSQVWLDKLKSGGDAMDLLARRADAYLPVALGKGDQDGRVTVGGWDGDPYPDEEEDSEPLPDSAFERVDVFTFGGPETLQPSEAALALTAAVRAGDAEAAKRALADGADPNVMCDHREPPLFATLGLGSPYLEGGRFADVSLERQLALMSVLLEAGANPDPAGGEPAIHRAIHWADQGDEKDMLAQLRLLLDHGADPNAMGTFLRSAGERPLHVVARFNQWLAVLKLLVQRGADPRLTNDDGKTPRAWAEERVKSLEETLTKHAPLPGGGEPADSVLATTVFAESLMADEDQQEQVLKRAGANLLRAMTAESRQELARLRPVVAFLADAEQGKADVSDIDALAAASSEQYARARQKDGEQREAARSALENAMKNLTATFRQQADEDE